MSHIVSLKRRQQPACHVIDVDDDEERKEELLFNRKYNGDSVVGYRRANVPGRDRRIMRKRVKIVGNNVSCG